MNVEELEACMEACRDVIQSCSTVCGLALSAVCNAPDKDEEEMRTLYHKTKEALEEAKALYAKQTNTTRSTEQTNAIRRADLTNAIRSVR